MNEIQWEEIPFERKRYLDASAVLKLVLNEVGSQQFRTYFSSHADQGYEFYMTSLCFGEAIGRLKAEHFYRSQITQDEYFRGCVELISYLGLGDIQLDELSLTDFEVLNQTLGLARTYSLDLSDALQIMTVKYGKWAPLVGESESLLITADGPLAEAARNEGLNVWDCLREPPPA